MIFRNNPYKFTFNTGVTGRVWQGLVSKDGATYDDIEGNIYEIGEGGYVLDATANDLNGNIIEYLLIEANNPLYDSPNPLKYEATVVTMDPISYNGASYINELETVLSSISNKLSMGDGSVIWTYIMYTDNTLTVPLEGCHVKITRDIEGQIPFGEQFTNTQGITRWMVDRGESYYIWRRMIGWRFNDPDLEEIPLIGPLSVSTNFGEIEEYSEDGEVGAMDADAVMYSYTVYSDEEMNSPLKDCTITITSDPTGDHVVRRKLTNSSGTITCRLKPAIYYIWRKKQGYFFQNPVAEPVGLSSDEVGAIFSSEGKPTIDERISWTYSVFADEEMSIPLSDCVITLTTDNLGKQIVDRKRSDDNGKSYWKLMSGDYYLWRQKRGYLFSNPEKITISADSIVVVNKKTEDDKSTQKNIAKWTYSMYTDAAMSNPLKDCMIVLSRDIEGSDVIDKKLTDSNGNTQWELPKGKYYVWRKKRNYVFDNPIEEIIQ